MKFNFKDYLKLVILFFGISLLITGCQEENIESQQANKEIIVKIIDFNEVQSNSKVVVDRLNKLSS